MTSEDKTAAAIIGGSMATGLVDEKGREIVLPIPTFCRETGASSLSFGLYRPDARNDNYLLAVHDAGRAITVGRNALAETIGLEMNLKRAAPIGPQRYSVSFVELDKTQIFGDFETLPLPEQAVEQVEKSAPIAVVGTWGKDTTITIVTD